jgi:hypothetical protein
MEIEKFLKREEGRDASGINRRKNYSMSGGKQPM